MDKDYVYTPLLNCTILQKVSYLNVPMKVKVFSYENGTKTTLNDHVATHNRTLKCFESKCAPVTVLHMGTIKYSKYYVEVGMILNLFNKC